MLDLSRREAFVSAAAVAAAVAAGVPTWALADVTAGTGAAWDLGRNLPDRRGLGSRPQGDPGANSDVGCSIAASSGRARPSSRRRFRRSPTSTSGQRGSTPMRRSRPTRTSRRAEPGAQEPGAGRLHRAWRGDSLDQPGNRRSRCGQGRIASSPPIPGSTSSPSGFATSFGRRRTPCRPTRRSCLLRPERRCPDRRISATSSPPPTFRGRRSSSATAAKSGSTTRAIRLLASAQSRRPQDGLRQVLGKLQGVRKLARHGARRPGQGRHVPGQGAPVRQRARRPRSTAAICPRRSIDR